MLKQVRLPGQTELTKSQDRYVRPTPLSRASGRLPSSGCTNAVV